MSPFDPRATPDRPGVDLSKIEATAVPVCRLAVKLNPDDESLWFQLGRALTADQQYLEAVKTLRAAAGRGSVESESMIGSLYADHPDSFTAAKESFRCTHDRDCDLKAVTWYAMAAKQGFANAQKNLGWMYDVKRGVRGRIEGADLNCTYYEDCSREAVTWFAKAANQGDDHAMLLLARKYRNQSGVTTIDDPALRCNDKASCDAKAKALDEQRKALSP
jgi:TPR repeat protein